MGKTLDEAIAFARKHGMTVEEVGDRRIRVTYPSGEYRVMGRDDADTPKQIIDMTCNLL